MSQPNLLEAFGVTEEISIDQEDEEGEGGGIREASSNPNLLEEPEEIPTRQVKVGH